jgi:hypothetical protein
MIWKGDRLENPVTGEVLLLHRTSRDTGGQAVLVETIVSPDGFVPAAHVHPHQTERFEVLEGRLRVGTRSFSQDRRCHERRAGHAAPFLERRPRPGALPLRGAPPHSSSSR